jgi:hypothetical protein
VHRSKHRSQLRSCVSRDEDVYGEVTLPLEPACQFKCDKRTLARLSLVPWNFGGGPV